MSRESWHGLDGGLWAAFAGVDRIGRGARFYAAFSIGFVVGVLWCGAMAIEHDVAPRP